MAELSCWGRSFHLHREGIADIGGSADGIVFGRLGGIHANAVGWSALEQGNTDFSGADCAVIDFQASGTPEEKGKLFWHDMAAREVRCIPCRGWLPAISD